MASTLVIVESPAKAKTISKFLGRGYKVRASMGHVRDLPKSTLGVDVEHDFQPKYITIRGRGKAVQELRSEAKKADQVLLATDPDREGEAISWHLAELLGLPDGKCRIEFREITKRAIQDAVKHPRSIDARLVDAQQARRVLDRLVGYKLSPLLWAKVRKGLSAGRVQSVAVRLIVDRESEIEAFVPQEYWSITARLRKQRTTVDFDGRLIKRLGEKIEVATKEQADAVMAGLAGQRFVVQSVVKKERRRNPAAPFTTSSLQQEASRKLGFPARKTMMIAQQLYEGLEVGDEGSVGLITYMRTDSTRISHEAATEAADFIQARYGSDYRPERPPQYKSKAGAQEAHEAVRPTSVLRTPEHLKPFLKRDQLRLYELIWQRFLASQMNPAVLDTVSVDIQAGEYTFRANGSTVKFPGFMVLYVEKAEDEADENDRALPPLDEGEVLDCRKIDPAQHFTEPPPRYSEAMLVKTLEELGIGRPSTYASIIDTIQKRAYVAKEDRRFYPTELGRLVVELLREHFPDIVDVEFTAGMEDRLDRIEDGQTVWVKVIADFYRSFEELVKKAYEEVEEVSVADEVTDQLCDVCGRNMVIKWGRFGKFLACPSFPECRNTKPILEEIGVLCPQCQSPVVERRSRKGRVFYGCSGYPDCDFTSWDRPVDQRCERCGKIMVQKGGRGRERIVCIDRECGDQPSEVGKAAGNGRANGKVARSMGAARNGKARSRGTVSAGAMATKPKSK